MSNNRQLDASFINFLVDKVKNVDSPMIIRELCEEFKKTNKTPLSGKTVNYRINKLRYKIDEIEHIDTETKVKMIFALSAPVGDGFLTDLRKQAIVELDEHRRIIKYEEKGEGLKLNGVHSDQNHRYDMEIEKEMMQFFADKCQNASSPINTIAIAREFISFPGVSLSVSHIAKRVRRMKNQIYLAPEYDRNTKIKMLFVSGTQIHESILEELREDAVVEVDDKRRIIEYKANDGSLELIGDHSQSTKIKTGMAEWKRRSGFVNDSEDQNQKDQCTKSENVKSSKVAKTKKISMSFMSAEIKGEDAKKRKRSRNTYFSESDEETEDDGEEVEEVEEPKKRRSNRKRYVSETYEESEEESFGEEDSFESCSLITESRKVSKRRYPEIDFANMFSENVKESKMAETKQATDSANFILQTPLENNQRRPIVRSFSVISTTSENTESTTDMNVQNSMESIEFDFTMDNPVTVPDNLNFDSETNQESYKSSEDSQNSDVEEELIQQKRIEIGEEECKPDLSFLNFEGNFIETRENSIADMEESNVPRGSNGEISNHTTQSQNPTDEKTDELVNGKDFLIMIRGLVRTLASSNLGELKSKIEDAIDKVGNQKIVTDDIVQTLKTGFLILSLNAKLEPPPEEFTSLRDFSLILLGTLSTLSSPSLDTFQLKVQKTITELAVQDEFVSIQTIRTVLDTVLLLFIS